MRLDKYLKVSRLIKRRTVANEACDNGLVSVNGKPARASYEVKVGDQIALRFGARTLTVEVLSVKETVKQADAAALYQEIKKVKQDRSHGSDCCLFLWRDGKAAYLSTPVHRVYGGELYETKENQSPAGTAAGGGPVFGRRNHLGGGRHRRK